MTLLCGTVYSRRNVLRLWKKQHKEMTGEFCYGATQWRLRTRERELGWSVWQRRQRRCCALARSISLQCPNPDSLLLRVRQRRHKHGVGVLLPRDGGHHAASQGALPHWFAAPKPPRAIFYTPGSVLQRPATALPRLMLTWGVCGRVQPPSGAISASAITSSRPRWPLDGANPNPNSPIHNAPNPKRKKNHPPRSPCCLHAASNSHTPWVFRPGGQRGGRTSASWSPRGLQSSGHRTGTLLWSNPTTAAVRPEP